MTMLDGRGEVAAAPGRWGRDGGGGGNESESRTIAGGTSQPRRLCGRGNDMDDEIPF